MVAANENTYPLSIRVASEGCRIVYPSGAPKCTRGDHKNGSCYNLERDCWFGYVRGKGVLIFPRRDENGVPWRPQPKKKRKKVSV
jgi:hypothetical protein